MTNHALWYIDACARTVKQGKEDAIDDDFTPLEQSAWGGLLGMHGRLVRAIAIDLQRHSQISHAEFEALLRLSWAVRQRLRIQDLAAQSLLTRSGMSRVVERLERAGLVEREGAIEDRRGAYAILTEQGAARLRAALRLHVAFVRRHFLEAFDNTELEQMATFWHRVEERQSADAAPETRKTRE